MGHSWHIAVPDTRLVRGGNAYEFHRPCRPDTRRHRDLADRRHDREAHLRLGLAMLVVTSEAAYTDQHGDLLMTNTETLVFTELPPAGGAS